MLQSCGAVCGTRRLPSLTRRERAGLSRGGSISCFSVGGILQAHSLTLPPSSPDISKYAVLQVSDLLVLWASALLCSFKKILKMC